MNRNQLRLVAAATLLGCLMPNVGRGEEAQELSYYGESALPPASVQQASTRSLFESKQPPAPNQTGPLAQAPPAGPACPDSACDTFCDPGPQLVASVEATWFWPQFNRDFITTQFNNGFGDQQVRTDAALGSVDGSLLVAPRITLGMQGHRWGVVGRYWRASSNATAFAPTLPDSPLTGITYIDAFQAYTADLELQRRFCWGNWDNYGFFGVRYASVNADRSFNIGNDFNDSLITASGFSAQQFNGTGFTFGLMGTRHLGCCGSPWSLFAANRYSILWGNGGNAVQTSASAADPTGFASSVDGAIAKAAGDLFIAEVQVGIQWEAQLRCLPGRAFVRTALEYQYWDSNSDVRTDAFSFAGVNNSFAAANTSAGDILFDLIGFNIGAGIMY